MPHNKDILWKGLLEWVFDDLLRFVFPDADKLFNWQEPVVYMDKELAALVPGSEDEMTARVVDKLAKVGLKKKNPDALVHIEVQGQTEIEKRRLFGVRMFHYYSLIFAKYAQPMAGIAIYTGGDGHAFPKGYSASLMNSWVHYNFDTIDIRDYSDERLAASDNRFAWALLIAKQGLLGGKNRELRLLESKWFVFQLLYANGLFQDHKLQRLLLFMRDYVPFEDPEISRIFEERCDSLTGKTKTMDLFMEQIVQIRLDEARQEGVQEGKKEGLEEGERIANEKTVRQMLSETEFSDEKIAAWVGVTVSQVAAIRKQLCSK